MREFIATFSSTLPIMLAYNLYNYLVFRG